MDLLDHLTNEHRTVEGLLDRLRRSDAGSERDDLVTELADALRVHMEVEERFLYPIAREVVGDEQVDEAENEHGLARDGLEQMLDLSDERGFGAAVEMVRAGIDHHVREEEGDLFPQLRDGAAELLAELDPEELEAEVRSRRP